MLCCSSSRHRFCAFIRDYDRLQSFAVIFIYIQIGCALVGSLGALYNGVLLINLGIQLFALIAIETSSQSLVRTYAVLLFCAILLDISWFILFSKDIWNISSQHFGKLFIFSVKLAFLMHIAGFSVRLVSSFFWIQMYKLGVSSSHGLVPQAEYSFLNPTSHAAVIETSDSDEIVGGSVCYHNTTSFSSLFEDGQCSDNLHGIRNNVCGDLGSTSTAEAHLLKPSLSKHFQAIDEEKALEKPNDV